MTVPFGQPISDESRAKGQTTNARNARAARTRKWLDYEELVDKDLRDPSCSKKERVELIRAQDTVAERLRILSGAVKPGSRNVSVRELSAAEQRKSLPISRKSDFIRDALATMERQSVVPPEPPKPTE
jgi:hypothetical protein